ASLESCFGASICGAKTITVIEKEDLPYIFSSIIKFNFVKSDGAFVIVVVDDIDKISALNDVKEFAKICNLPLIDCKDTDECYEILSDCFKYSQRYKIPVIMRVSSNIFYSTSVVDVESYRLKSNAIGLTKSQTHIVNSDLILNKQPDLISRKICIQNDFSTSQRNQIEGKPLTKKAILTDALCYNLVKTSLELLNANPKLLKISTIYPMPVLLIKSFLENIEELLIIEECSDYIKKEIQSICYEYNFDIKIIDNINPMVYSGLSLQNVCSNIAKYLNINYENISTELDTKKSESPKNYLCAGCPYNMIISAIKIAMQGKKYQITSGLSNCCYNINTNSNFDIYINKSSSYAISAGVNIVNEKVNSFILTDYQVFLHSGLQNTLGCVYNSSNITICILSDFNNTEKNFDLKLLLSSIGIKYIKKVNPYDIQLTKKLICDAENNNGVKVIIFEGECIKDKKPAPTLAIDQEKCIGCRECIKLIGCSALKIKRGEVIIDEDTCFGCQ
ncbi:MAG: hypothetical protein RSE93_08225, partial [Oscillospiraceae bacterium]